MDALQEAAKKVSDVKNQGSGGTQGGNSDKCEVVKSFMLLKIIHRQHFSLCMSYSTYHHHLCVKLILRSVAFKAALAVYRTTLWLLIDAQIDLLFYVFSSKKIRELTAELEGTNQRCEVYRANLLAVLKDMEEQKLKASCEGAERKAELERMNIACKEKEKEMGKKYERNHTVKLYCTLQDTALQTNLYALYFN
ncbi:hypothetical protein POTOM_018101 [Populus tomentosa]|uniref:Uncharacterized protein n=1 Tax=Populus tomentosa TaxID=118781 RepID=A0A8X8A1J4_POPTO|nr:hypothetical protein POTOM_018101 [Populus tomentosa]